MNKKILNTRKNEISKAGRMVFDAFFGDTKEFERKLGEELDDEARARGQGTLPAPPDSIVRCAGCAREQTVPANVDVRVLEGQGWRFDAGAWRCPFCVAK